MAIYKKTAKRTGITWFYIHFWLKDGRAKVEKAGTKWAEAQTLLKDRVGQVANGSYVDPRQAKKADLTFAQFGERFMREYPGRKRSTHYPLAFKVLAAFFGDRPLREITRADLDRFAGARQRGEVKVGEAKARKVGDSTIRKNLIAVGTIYKTAIRWGVVKVNPAVDLIKPGEPKRKVRHLSRDEWDRFEAACPPWLRPIATLAVATGMRLKEVVSVRWDDVDRQANAIHVAEDAKTGTRVIHFGAMVRTVLDGQVRRVRSPFVFLDSAGEPYTSKDARDRIGKATVAAMRAAEIEGASFHTLRHTAASWMVQAGVPLYEVQAILGHTTPVMTVRYAHLAPDFSRRGAAAVDAVLLSPATQSATGRGAAS